MSKGFLLSILYYLIGFGIAGLCYLTVEQTYAHGPGLHHMIMFLTFLGGVFWMIGAMIRYNFTQRKKTLSGIMITNLIVSLGIIVLVRLMLHNT